jgi:cobalt-zinc-cadmium efflux system membrane fusion protein
VPRVQADRIEFSPAFAARIGLRYEAVRVEELVPVIAAVGTAELNPEHVAAVGARLRGLVSRVKKFEGDSVDVGTLLAKIESPELGEAQAAASMLDAQRKVALVNAAREVSLAQRQLTTAKEVETATVEARRASFMLQAAKQKVAALGSRVAASGTSSFGTLELRSPIKGTIVERNVAPGQFVQGDIVAFQIANLDHLWVELDVFERSLGQVRVGDEAELKPMAAASKALIGHVAKIASEIDPETRSAKVRVEVENREHQWRVGQAVKATIHSSGGPAALRTTVRTEAITFVDGKPTVFVMSGPNAVRVVNVHLGAHDDHSTEVLDGIAPSDRVVTDGAFALKGELFR